jgi:cytochrome c biogenesis protein CcmG, thiol:disulfide interchange protein DsbE
MPWRIFGRLILQVGAILVVVALIALLAARILTQADAKGLVADVRAGGTPPAPPLELPLLDGDGTVSLASYRGKAVVLNFWASWCEPCKDEAPMLQEAWERYRDRGVVVVGVNAQDFRRDARGFAERYGLTYPILHDGRGSSLGRYGVAAFPETWWVGRNGTLVAYVQGQFTEEELELNIERALEAAS